MVPGGGPFFHLFHFPYAVISPIPKMAFTSRTKIPATRVSSRVVMSPVSHWQARHTNQPRVLLRISRNLDHSHDYHKALSLLYSSFVGQTTTATTIITHRSNAPCHSGTVYSIEYKSAECQEAAGAGSVTVQHQHESRYSTETDTSRV